MGRSSDVRHSATIRIKPNESATVRRHRRNQPRVARLAPFGECTQAPLSLPRSQQDEARDKVHGSISPQTVFHPRPAPEQRSHGTDRHRTTRTRSLLGRPQLLRHTAYRHARPRIRRGCRRHSDNMPGQSPPIHSRSRQCRSSRAQPVPYHRLQIPRYCKRPAMDVISRSHRRSGMPTRIRRRDPPPS